MAAITLTIDGKMVSAVPDQSVLEVARDAGVNIPTLCHLDGASDVGACRLCMVEIVGQTRLQPSCILKASEGLDIRTDTETLKKYRRMIVELLFAERNHVCSACVSNGNCELQNLAKYVGMDHSRFPYISPSCEVDISHARFGLDHNRCILCTRCVRTCDEIEGAHTWDVAGRGANARVISDMNQPWGTSISCTSCGKCVQACPTGALFNKGATVGEMKRDRTVLDFIVTAREEKKWIE